MIRIKVIKKAKQGATGFISGGFSSGSGGGSASEAAEAAHALRADYADLAGSANYAAKAGEADHAALSDLAVDLTPDSPANDRFLRKDQADRTPHSLSVGGDLVAEDVMRSLSYAAGLNGYGWGTDKRGNFSMESLTVRSFMEIAELITNRLTALEGDTTLTESDTIEEVTAHADGTYTLYLHPKWEGYFTAQIENNVIRGIFNDITSQVAPGQGQTTINNATYYTSWMRVLTVNAAANTIDVALYPDAEVPAGRNFPPQAMMRIARWGNSGSADIPRYAQRQECLYLSSTEGRIVKHYRVTKPIVDDSNIAFSLGNPHDFLRALNIGIEADDPVVYAKTLVAENIIYLDHRGRPKPTIRFRGPFDELADYFGGDTLSPDFGDYEQSVVEYFGCQWLCNVTGTHEPPSWRSTAWTFYLGDSSFKVELLGGPVAFNPRRFKFTLTVKGTKCGQDVTADILPQDVVWTRYSEDADGVQRLMSDNIWAAKRGGSGMELTLEPSDLDAQTALPPVCVFTASVTLRDGAETAHVDLGFDIR